MTTSTKRIAVAGGTGAVGKHVAISAEDRGLEVVVLSRGHGVDLMTGAGLTQALDGVDAVVDVSNVQSLKQAESVRFFETATRNLLAAEQSAGVAHHVVLSIVGIDGAPAGYYAGKLRQGQLVASGSVPWTILRATQFHEFPGQLLAQARGPVVPVPRMSCATVAASEVAERLVALATSAPAGHAADMGGPERQQMPDLVRRLLAARGRRALVVPVRVPGAIGRVMRSGALIPDSSATVGTQTFDAWLRAVS